MDKLRFTKIYGNWFVLAGIANIFCYGLSHIMTKKNYEFHFAYSNYPTRFFTPLKSMVGANNFWNVAITAPLLILCGGYLS